MGGQGHGGSVASKWEWIAGAISAVVVLAILGVLISEAATEHTPPDVHVRVDSIVQQDGQYLVAFTVDNRGSSSAADLEIEGELRADTSLVESSTVTIDYLPGESIREGGLFFQRDPRRLALSLRPLGYQVP